MMPKSDVYVNYVIILTLLSIVIGGLYSFIPSVMQLSMKDPPDNADFLHVGTPIPYLDQNDTLSGRSSMSFNVDCPGGGAYPEIYISAHSLYMKNKFADPFNLYFRDSLGNLIWSSINVTSTTKYMKRNAPGAFERYEIEL